MRMPALVDGGAERTRQEFAMPLEKAGLGLTRQIELSSGTSVLEALCA
jgi:hypothetical protein